MLRLLLSGLLALAIGASSARAQAVVSLSDPGAEASFQLAPGVIVAPHAGLVFARSLGTGNGIEALDARSLRVRAQTAQAALPLLLHDGQLLAVAPGNGLRLVWLDGASLRQIRAEPAVEVPDWVAASALDGAAGRFTWSADVSDAVYVRFAASARHVAEEPARGMIKLEPASGPAQVVDHAPVSTTPAHFRLSEPMRAGPFFVQGLSIVVSVVGSEQRSVRVERRRLSDGVRLAALSFALPAGIALLSLDRSALWIAEPGAEGSIAAARIVSTSKGDELLHLPFVGVPEACLRAGKQLWFVDAEGLGALELGSGARSRPRPLFGREAPASAPAPGVAQR